MEVGHRQQQGLLGCQPFGPGAALALGTMAIAAGVVTDPLRPARLADFDMAAERSRAALRNRSQHPRLLLRDVVGSAERLPVLPHDVRHLKGRRGGWAAGLGAVGGDNSRGMAYPAAGVRPVSSRVVTPGRPHGCAPRARSAWWS